MFDRVNDLSGSLIGTSGGDGDVDAGPFADLLENGERPQYALASDSVEHVTEGRTTTVQPDGDHDAYLVVTDQRLLIVLGDQPDVVEIEFDFESVAKCNYRSGFLNSKLVVGHEDEEIHFSPTDGDVETVEEYVDRVADVYRSVESAIATADEMLEGLEVQIREEGAEDDSRLRMQSQLSEARHNATHYDIVPSEKLLERIETARDEFDRRYITVWLDRGEADVERAQSALDDDFGEFCTALDAAVRAVTILEDTMPDIDETPDNADERIEALATRVEELGETYEQKATDAYEAATSAEETELAAESWLEVYRRLANARDADWPQESDLPDVALEADVEAVAAETIDALESHADSLEETGEACEDDGDTEQARDHYEAAAERLEAARDVASRQTGDGSAYDERLDELTEKIERTEWQWGGD